MKPPARAIVGNLIWSTDGGVWAVWEAAPFPHAHLATADKLAIHAQIRGLRATYFYTANEGEKDLVQAQYPHFRFEGEVFNLPRTGDLLPVYRFANIETGGYLFTQNPAEREAARLLPFMREENGGEPAFMAPDQAVDLSLLVSTSPEPAPEVMLVGQTSLADSADMGGIG